MNFLKDTFVIEVVWYLILACLIKNKNVLAAVVRTLKEEIQASEVAGSEVLHELG